MACNNSTLVYWAGTTFSSAPQLYTNSTLTTVAPDGLYSFGNIYRVLSGGILGPPIKCPTCLFDCSSATLISGGNGSGRYRMDVNVGATTGAIIVRFEPVASPTQLTWTFDGLTASEYSSATWGYKQGLIGQQDITDDGGASTCNGFYDDFNISNNNGSSNVTFPGYQRVYDFQANTFVAQYDVANNPIPITLGPYNSSNSVNPPNVQLVNGAAGFFTMVIPKPNATPETLTLELDAICTYNNWNIDINCPVSLNSFSAGVSSGTCGVHTTTIYTASVSTTTGVSSTIGVNDWVFSDINGVAQLPAGRYPVLIGGVNNIIVVDTNGVVTSVAPC